MAHHRFWRRSRRTATVVLTALLAALPTLAPVPASAATPTPLSSAICGTWVLQQVSSVTELNNYKTQIDAALSLPGVVGLSIRFPWNSVDTDFTLLNAGLAMARAKGKALSIRFMAGRWTPARVFTAGSPYYVLSSGEKVPSPFYSDGSPNTVFEGAYDEYVGRLAAWSRANGVNLLHLSWYGQDWAELNNGAQVRAVPGYTQAVWTNSMARLIDIGARYAGSDLAVELPLSGYGPLSNGPSAALADKVVATVGAGSDHFFIQANGWGPNGDWGAPDATVEAQFDQIWTKPVRRGEQAIQPQDYNWTTLYGYLYQNDADYSEVYLPSFNMASKALLASEIKKFSDSRCGAPAPGDTTAPTVSVTAPAGGQRVAGTVTVSAQASDNVGVSRVDLLVDGAVVASASAASASTPWNTTGVADGTHTISARALDAAGNVGTSTPVGVTVDNTAPAVPGGLTATPGDGQVTVGFGAVGAADLAGYDVRLKTSAATAWGAPVSTTATSWTFTGLADGTSYDVAVRSRDDLGNASAWSAPVTATPVFTDTQPPTVPTGFTSTTTRTSVQVCWSPSSDNVGVAGYWVSLNGSWVATTTSTCRQIDNLSRGTAYTAGVRAFDAAGNGSAMGTVKVATRK
ncbi:MAG TPA: Ig-like domain-containing protein, partial [Acidimicrobiia bacterium]|nr:Ig-like domain-containing protein [Acidimicrobiia bacterium]